MNQPERSNWYDFKEAPVARLTPRLLREVNDVINKWGRYRRADQLFLFKSGNIGLDFRLGIALSLQPENRFLAVGRYPDSGEMEAIETSSGVVYWDGNLAAKQVRRALFHIDSQAYESGMLDVARGVKQPLDTEHTLASSETLLLDEVFATKGSRYQVYLGEDADEQLQRFDRPDELMIARSVHWNYVIYKKSESDLMKRREEIVCEVFVEKGVLRDGINLLPEFSTEQRKEISDEVQRRFNEELLHNNR